MEGFIEIEPGFGHSKEFQDCEDGGVRQGGPEPFKVGADRRVGAVQRGIEVAFSRHDVQQLLLEFCWPDGSVFCCASFFFGSIHKIVIGLGVGRLVLELCEEEVVAPSGITHALDGRCAIVTTKLLFPLLPDSGTRRLWANPSFAVEDATEGRLEVNLPGDTDVVKKKGVNDFRIGECPKIKLE